MSVITRFPPSPTGFFHIGGARTALFNYLFAASKGGTMYFRFEDTDAERSKREFEEDIQQGMEWLKIPYAWPDIRRQSERSVVYKAHLKMLIEKGAAYEAEASTDNPDKKVIRFKNPNTTITFKDLVRGEVTFKTDELKDFVIARSIDEPLYHLAVVIDDHETAVTHVIRGEDHISNTPRQILILEALGFERPQYAHIPLILAPDRSKLSKRHGAVSVNEYKAQGFLPQAVVNYLALLGWNPGGEQEIFSMQEMVGAFDIAQVQKAGAIFDIEKLKWFNRQHLLRMREDDFSDEVLRILEEEQGKRGQAFEENVAHKLVSIIRERISTWNELREMIALGEFDYFFADPQLVAVDVVQKASTAGDAGRHLASLEEIIHEIPDADFSDAEKIKAAIWPYAEQEGRGNVLWPLRYSLSGRKKSPDPFILTAVLGKETTLRRIKSAVELLARTGQ